MRSRQEGLIVVSDYRKPRWYFYPGWVVVSAFSMLIAWAIAWVIISQIVKAVGATVQLGGQTHITEDFLLFYIYLPVLGLVTGVLQYLLLRRYLPQIALWIPATVLGWSECAVVIGLSAILAGVAFPPWVVVLLGASIGLPQWWVLRKQVSHAAIWLMASVLGWCVALLLNQPAIRIQAGVLGVVFMPSIVASIAWWLLFEKLPKAEHGGGHTPRNTSMPLSVP